MIFNLFFRGGRTHETIEGLYGVIVAQARAPAFYTDYGVPDMVESRFDLIMLHLILLLRRLRGETSEAQALAQKVFDRFCRDMEHNLREMGVSDLSVPKRMRAVGEAFYGRAGSYDAAFDAAFHENDPSPLVAALARNIYGNAEAPGASRLAAYVRSAEAALADQALAEIAAGKLHFPPLR